MEGRTLTIRQTAKGVMLFSGAGLRVVLCTMMGSLLGLLLCLSKVFLVECRKRVSICICITPRGGQSLFVWLRASLSYPYSGHYYF
jgi:hypothetical protein